MEEHQAIQPLGSNGLSAIAMTKIAKSHKNTFKTKIPNKWLELVDKPIFRLKQDQMKTNSALLALNMCSHGIKEVMCRNRKLP